MLCFPEHFNVKEIVSISQISCTVLQMHIKVVVTMPRRKPEEIFKRKLERKSKVENEVSYQHNIHKCKKHGQCCGIWKSHTTASIYFLSAIKGAHKCKQNRKALDISR